MRTLIAIPVYNEDRYVSRVVSEVTRYASDVLVIDDGSDDQTPCLLAKLPVDVIRHAYNRGYGRSIRDAFQWASCYGYDWLITMDCDEQHEPASLPDFLNAIAQNDCDIVSGSRYLESNGRPDRPPEDRRRINTEISKKINDCLNLSITDAFCGFKAYRVESLRKLYLTEDGYAMPLQLWIQAAANNLRIKELAIRLIYRDRNRSFGGPLDDPEHRLAHYLDVFGAELQRFEEEFLEAVAGSGSNRS